MGKHPPTKRGTVTNDTTSCATYVDNPDGATLSGATGSARGVVPKALVAAADVTNPHAHPSPRGAS